jgi:hypothetical protein
MKILLITLAVACLAVPAMAQDVHTWAYAGVEYESDVGVTSTLGVSQRLSDGLYLLPRTTIGRYGNVDTDVGYFWELNSDLALALVAGPGVTWEDQPDQDFFGLVTGAAGCILHYHWAVGWADRMGVAAGAKYKFGVDNEYDDGWHGGLFLTYAL